jgi:hypothetical protein
MGIELRTCGRLTYADACFGLGRPHSAWWTAWALGYGFHPGVSRNPLIPEPLSRPPGSLDLVTLEDKNNTNNDGGDAHLKD